MLYGISKILDTVIIPGMGYNKSLFCSERNNNFSRPLNPFKEQFSFLKSVIVFDYESKGNMHNIGRYLLNSTGYRTKAQYRLAELLEDVIRKTNNSKQIQIIAHSHGALILYSFLRHFPKYRPYIKQITTFGAARVIPQSSIPSGNILNVYHKNDWVLRFINPTIRSKSYNEILTMKDSKIIIYSPDRLGGMNPICRTDDFSSHLIFCYRFFKGKIRDSTQKNIKQKNNLPKPRLLNILKSLFRKTKEQENKICRLSRKYKRKIKPSNNNLKLKNVTGSLNKF